MLVIYVKLFHPAVYCTEAVIVYVDKLYLTFSSAQAAALTLGSQTQRVFGL